MTSPGPTGAAAYAPGSFQRTMLLWEEAHPYNAAHIVRLEGRADPGALEAAIREAVRSAGVETLLVDGRSSLCRWSPGGEVRLRVLEAAAGAPDDALRSSVAGDMDRPFPLEPCHPVRWSVLDDPRSGCHELIAVYRHVAGDAHSMRTLIANALAAYLGAGRARPIRPRGATPGRARRGPRLALASAASLLRAARLYARLRRAHRFRERRGASPTTGWRSVEPGPAFLERLRDAARARGYRLGELFTAALSSALAEHTPERRRHPRRRRLALGVVRDLRDEDPEGLADDFAVHIGQAVVIVEDPDEPDFEKLLAGIARSLREEKAARSFSGPQGAFLALASARRLVGRRRTRAWYRKVFPLSAGLSNVRWGADAFGALAQKLLAYRRVAPLGPALPLVVAPTTAGSRFSIAISYLESAFGAEQAAAIEAAFLRRLEEFSRTAAAKRV